MSNILNLDSTILYNSIKKLTPEEEERIKQHMKRINQGKWILKIAKARYEAIETYKRISNHQTNTTLYNDIPLLT